MTNKAATITRVLCSIGMVGSTLLTVVGIYNYKYSNIILTNIKQTLCKDHGNCRIDRNSKNVAVAHSHTIDNTSTRYICPDLIHYGRLGNKLFQFASSYGIAKSKGMRLYIDESCPLLKIFKIKKTASTGSKSCKQVKKMVESKPSVYDEKMLNFTTNVDIQPLYYLQSYRYFETYSAELRQELRFRDNIQEKAKYLLRECIRNHKIDNKKVTLIGVHVRRGDIVPQLKQKRGKQLATKEYLNAAVAWYNNKYNNLLFIVASDGIEWAKKNMPRNISVSFLEGNSPDIDIATISSCNHFIMSVGSFGWWAGWLTGGNVLYYKWPARENSVVHRLYYNNYSDVYFPTWIGL